MSHPRRRVQDVEIEARRARVASMLLGGVTSQRTIAESLNVSEATISRDVRQIEKQWQASAVQDIAAAKGKDLERTERLIAALWNDARNGRWLATDRVLNLMQHRARLLGLEAPKTVNVNMVVQKLVEQAAAEDGLTEDEKQELYASVIRHLDGAKA
jgi:uncharacterized protein YerC